MLDKLIFHINRYVQLTDKEIDILHNNLEVISISKKEQIHKAGKLCKAKFFVSRGCMRSFFINDKGVEQILQFAIENWWISDYESLERGIVSNLYIEAIEDCELVVFKKEVEDIVFEQVPKLERYFRLVLERERTAALTKIKYMFEFSKEQEYRHFHESFPSFLERVPDYMIASYLGLTPEYLSVIRKRM